jgi:hypothetical protein
VFTELTGNQVPETYALTPEESTGKFGVKKSRWVQADLG